MAGFIRIANVASVQPAFAVDSCRSSFRTIPITLHNLRTANANLAFVVGSDCPSRLQIDDLAFGIWGGYANRAKFYLRRISRRRMRDRTRFRHSITLTDI